MRILSLKSALSDYSVGAETEIAVADFHDVYAFGHFGAVERVEHQIVVAECVVFGEFHNACKLYFAAARFQEFFCAPRII